MKAIFVLPRIDAKRFTGGIWCIFKKASALSEAGWDVELIPAYPSPRPEWFDLGGMAFRSEGRTSTTGMLCAMRKLGSSLLSYGIQRYGKEQLRTDLHEAISRAMRFSHAGLSEQLLAAASYDNLREIEFNADIIFATSYETAELVHLCGTGRKAYLCQHFEPYFAEERASPALASLRARQSYHLGLELVANSSWLREELEGFSGQNVWFAPNGIDNSVFHPVSKRPEGSAFVVASYGGRQARWKGFKEMAEGMRLFKESSTFQVKWMVYGGAVLPPDNPICSYQDCGYLDHVRLNELYNEASCLLSASYYESYPLFPLEAMACGLPVIAGKIGTEDYACDGENCLWVDPIEPAKIAEQLTKMASDPQLQASLSKKGIETAASQDWSSSNKRFIHVIESILKTPKRTGA